MPQSPKAKSQRPTRAAVHIKSSTPKSVGETRAKRKSSRRRRSDRAHVPPVPRFPPHPEVLTTRDLPRAGGDLSKDRLRGGLSVGGGRLATTLSPHCRESRSRSYQISDPHIVVSPAYGFVVTRGSRFSAYGNREIYTSSGRAYGAAAAFFPPFFLTRSSPIFIHSSNRNTGVLGQHKKRQLRVLLSCYIEQRSVSEPNHQKN